MTSKRFFFGVTSVLFKNLLSLNLIKILKRQTIMTKPISNIILGLSGATGIEVANQIEIPTSTEVKDIVSVVIQIIIGIVTLFGLIKKDKPKT